MSLVWEARRQREGGSEVSAVRMGMEGGGGFGAAAHLSDWVNFDGFRPAKAMDLSGEVLRNLRASRTTYFPVKPEAPRIMMS